MGPAPTTTTTTAWVQDRYGPLDGLRLGEVPVPTPGKGEVLVEVATAGVDPSVWHLMTGTPYLVRLATGLRGPRQPGAGSEGAGTVVAVGEGVESLAVGQRAFGAVRGSFARYAVGRASALAPVPDGVPLEAAAALPISGTTALQAVRRAGVQEGDRVAVLGAGGGVGSYAVQLAARAGARVTGVCSATKADHVLALGAADVVDYRGRDITERPERYDVVVDTAGNRPLGALRRVLTDRGRLVIVGGEAAGPQLFGMGRVVRALLLSPVVRQRLLGLVATTRAEDLRELAGLLRTGELVAPVSRTYPLAEAVTALEEVRAGRVAGKAVVRVGD